MENKYKELFNIEEDDLELHNFLNSKINKITTTEYSFYDPLYNVYNYTKFLIINKVLIPGKNILYKIFQIIT